MRDSINRVTGSKSAVRNEANDAETRKKPSILHVDDEAGVRKIVLRALGKDYECMVAGSGTEALEVFKSGDIDLVISDFNMPGMNGLELLKALKAIDPNLKVIILSGGLTTEQMQTLREAGAVAILEKPFDCNALKAAAGAALGNSVWVVQEPQEEGLFDKLKK